MADVTINELTTQAPTTDDVFPFATAVSPSTYKASLAQIKTAMGLATVATTGSYADLINKPTIGLGGMQAFTSGTGTFTAPAGITNVKVTVIGGGGGGGGVSSGGSCPGGSGCVGGSAIGVKSVIAGTSYAVVVGAAGAAGARGNNGGAGGTSSFNGTAIYATGGQPGVPCGGCGGVGVGTGGALNLTGQSVMPIFGTGGSGMGVAGTPGSTAGGAGLVLVEW